MQKISFPSLLKICACGICVSTLISCGDPTAFTLKGVPGPETKISSPGSEDDNFKSPESDSTAQQPGKVLASLTPDPLSSSTDGPNTGNMGSSTDTSITVTNSNTNTDTPNANSSSIDNGTTIPSSSTATNSTINPDSPVATDTTATHSNPNTNSDPNANNTTSNSGSPVATTTQAPNTTTAQTPFPTDFPSQNPTASPSQIPTAFPTPTSSGTTPVPNPTAVPTPKPTAIPTPNSTPMTTPIATPTSASTTPTNGNSGTPSSTDPNIPPPNATSDQVAISKCLTNWAGHPFNNQVYTNYRKIIASISVLGFGNAVKDTTVTQGPSLILVDVSVNVLTNANFILMNPNGWYCFKVGVNVEAQLDVDLQCQAHITENKLGIDVSSSGGQTSTIGVNVLSNVNLNRMQNQNGGACN